MKTISAFACIALLAAGAAHAKGHDQSNDFVIDADGNIVTDGDPGANAGSETVAPAQTLGRGEGNDRNEGKARGRSASAGRWVE